ncbi:MAG: M56 family metallopeptidase [Candidatus Merdivicinus sp.]
MDTLIEIFFALVKISLTAGIIAGIVLLVRVLIGKKLPRRLSYALWGLVLLRLILPISLPSPTSIFTHTNYTPQNTVWQDLPATNSPFPFPLLK